jgi:hypothetical protein
MHIGIGTLSLSAPPTAPDIRVTYPAIRLVKADANKNVGCLALGNATLPAFSRLWRDCSANARLTRFLFVTQCFCVTLPQRSHCLLRHRHRIPRCDNTMPFASIWLGLGLALTSIIGNCRLTLKTNLLEVQPPLR